MKEISAKFLTKADQSVEAAERLLADGYAEFAASDESLEVAVCGPQSCPVGPDGDHNDTIIVRQKLSQPYHQVLRAG